MKRDGPNPMRSLDLTDAARLEVDWWRIHRELQHGANEDAVTALLAAVHAA
jgi:hypothetical protein